MCRFLSFMNILSRVSVDFSASPALHCWEERWTAGTMLYVTPSCFILLLEHSIPCPYLWPWCTCWTGLSSRRLRESLETISPVRPPQCPHTEQVPPSPDIPEVSTPTSIVQFTKISLFRSSPPDCRVSLLGRL